MQLGNNNAELPADLLALSPETVHLIHQYLIIDAVDIDDPLLDARHAGDAGCLVVVLDGDEGDILREAEDVGVHARAEEHVHLPENALQACWGQGVLDQDHRVAQVGEQLCHAAGGNAVIFDGGWTPALRQQEDLALRAADEIAGGGGYGALVLRLPGEAAVLRAPVHDRHAHERLSAWGSTPMGAARDDLAQRDPNRRQKPGPGRGGNARRGCPNPGGSGKRAARAP